MIKKLIAVSLIAAISLAGLSLTGCQTPSSAKGEEMAKAGETTFTISLPEGTESESIDRAVTLALMKREWTVTEREDNRITGKLDHRGINAQVFISWDDEAITIEDDSHRENGEPFVPVRWINNLRKDITENIMAISLL